MNNDINNKDINENKDKAQDITPKEKKRSENSILRRLKYGSVAMIFTIAFVAVIFVGNIVTTAISNVKPMMIDMTKEQIFGIGEATYNILKGVAYTKKDIEEMNKTVKELEKEIEGMSKAANLEEILKKTEELEKIKKEIEDIPAIEIVFFQPMDLYEKEVSYGKMIVNCIKLFENEFENITIREIDIIKEPGAAAEFKTSGLSQNPSRRAVAIKSKGKPKLYADNAFFTTASSTQRYWAFNGEKTIVSGILTAVSIDEPLVYFTSGHSESAPQELQNLFRDNGYRLEVIDLSMADQEKINEAKIIVIGNPQKDFIGASDIMEKSEIDKLASYLYQYGSVMYFSAPTSPPLTNLDQLLSEYGIAFEHDSVVLDDKQALDVNGLYLIANYYYNEKIQNVGDELTASIRKQPSPSKTIVPNAKPIKILNKAGERDVSPVLTSSASSFVLRNDGTKSNQETNNLLVVAQKTTYVDNNPKTSLLLVCGSLDFLGIVTNDAYSNGDILLNAMRIMTSKKVATELKFKLFDSTALSMSIEEQNNWTLICILLLPSIVAVLGVVVWLMRRHS
jgi:uncharacterized protein YoxC